MWIATKYGFYSAVSKGPKGSVCVRARVESDLENLRQFLPAMGEIIKNAGTDYPYRIYVNQSAWAEVMAEMATGIDYSNFKDEVAKTQGSARAHVYGDVWWNLQELERLERAESATKGKA